MRMRKCEFTLLREICQPPRAGFRVLFDTNNHSLKGCATALEADS